MKTLIKHEPQPGFEYIKDQPVPIPQPDEVLVRVQYVAICGSDINLYKWNDIAQRIATLPFTPGHEMTGIVEKLGSEVTDLSLGQRIAVENHFYCRNCWQCDNKRGDICAKMSQYGHGKGTIHGGFSEYSIVPSRYCYKLQDASSSRWPITPVQAVLLEPMAVLFFDLSGSFAHSNQIKIFLFDLICAGHGRIMKNSK